MTKLMFRHAFIIILVTHIPCTCNLCSHLEVLIRVLVLGRRTLKRTRIFTCKKKMDQPVKKTKADKEDFATLSASISNMSYWHLIG
jgi:hypothetical protein